MALQRPVPHPHYGKEPPKPKISYQSYSYPKPLLTSLAQKYGHPNGDEHIEIQGNEPLKSGFSPLDFNPAFSVKEYLDYWSYRTYQSDRFQGLSRLLLTLVSDTDTVIGFNTAMLEKMEAFGPAENSPFDFSNNMPLHPLYSKDKWFRQSTLHNPGFLIGDGTQGYFEVRIWWTWKEEASFFNG